MNFTFCMHITKIICNKMTWKIHIIQLVCFNCIISIKWYQKLYVSTQRPEIACGSEMNLTPSLFCGFWYIGHIIKDLGGYCLHNWLSLLFLAGLATTFGTVRHINSTFIVLFITDTNRYKLVTHCPHLAYLLATVRQFFTVSTICTCTIVSVLSSYILTASETCTVFIKIAAVQVSQCSLLLK